jgi:hypothetical protein
MNAFRVHHHAAAGLLWLALATWLMWPLGAVGATEDTFGVLQIGTRMYTNVTVTTKAKNYIFILHAAGMTSIKTADLPPELLQKLGYASASASKGATNVAAVWAKKELAKIDAPHIKDMRKQLEQKWCGPSVAKLTALGLIGSKPNRTALGIALSLCLLLHLFYCYCCMLICRKTGKPAGILIWLPGFQLFPMLRAAGMSSWWFLAFFVPVINLVPVILWPLKIAKARGKNVGVGILLFLPVINVFAFLYLAFSDGPSEEKDEGSEPKIMSLQTV